MKVLFKIALRNLLEHKTKTLIIGSIIFLGIIVLVMGNSMIDTSMAGIEKNYINNYTGHIAVTGSPEDMISLTRAMGPFKHPPVIPDYKKIKDYVSNLPYVEAVDSRITGLATIVYGDEEVGRASLWGIDPANYHEMFPESIEIIEGRFLENREEGILLNEAAGKSFKTNGEKLKIGDNVLLSGKTVTGVDKVREIPVVGIFRFKISDMALDRVSLIDIQNLRTLSGMTVFQGSETDLAEMGIVLLATTNHDQLFSTDFDEETIKNIRFEKTEEDLIAILGDTTERNSLFETDSDAWNFLLVKLTDPSKMKTLMADIKVFFHEENIAAGVQDWVAGAGAVASLANSIKIIFNCLILIVAVVAIIIIMNTLVIAVTERIGEIGTMRAIGAQKGFIRRMIIIETMMISGIFGSAGIVFSGILIGILNLTGITAPNEFFEIIFGGNVLNPNLTLGTSITAITVIVFIGIVSALYPVSVALRIQPVKAMKAE